MRLSSIHIPSYKRFTDLLIAEIPQDAKILLFVGPNGTGKSSVFDALHTWHQEHAGGGVSWDASYHPKLVPASDTSWRTNAISVTFHDEPPRSVEDYKRAIRVRPAYRNDPDVRVSQIRRQGDPLELRHIRMIDNDSSVSINYQKLVSAGVEDLFNIGQPETTFDDYRQSTIGAIATHLQKLFPSLILNEIGNPLDDGTFRFSKGISDRFPYLNLSGGEKAAFDIIVDLANALKHFDNTVHCIDEPESHLHTRVQAKLLSVLDELVPDQCQLVLATHSVGIIRRAQDIARAHPGKVAFFSFAEHDFDEPTVIRPSAPDRDFWQRQYEVVFDDLSRLVAPRQVVLCEGSPSASEARKNPSFDEDCLRNIFGATMPDTKFKSMGNDKQLIHDQWGLAEALNILIEELEVIRLVDRDNRTQREMDELREDGIMVLSRRTLESYLLDDEVLVALCESVDQPETADELLKAKQEIVGDAFNPISGNAKEKAGEIFEACKSTLSLDFSGSNRNAFMRDVLAPLVRPDMNVYEELEKDIFGYKA